MGHYPQCMKNAFAMCLSDTALTAFEKDGHYAALIAESNVNFMLMLMNKTMHFLLSCVCWLCPMSLAAL